MNGTFSFVYSGDRGLGIGVFVIRNSELTGADLSGVKYRGTVTSNPDTGQIEINLETTIPPEVFLVHGTSEQDVTYQKAGIVKAPPNFGNGKPFEAYVAPGLVTLMIRQVEDGWARFANGAIITPIVS
jgi:hypothetical protein